MTKLLGLIGGMSWESTELYCRRLNQLANEDRGGHAAAKFLVYSVDFGEIEAMQSEGRWNDTADILIDAARRLERGGADELLLCTNTMHIVADKIAAAVNVPLLHIADATGRHIVAHGVQKVGLLATKYTMEGDFYRDRMASKFGLDIVIPDAGDRETVNRIIYDELCHGIISPDSHRQYMSIAQKMIGDGARGIVLGCTEVGMLLKDGDVAVPLFDSALIHVDEAVRPSNLRQV